MICPFCCEEVQDGAIKCKHCRSMLVLVAPAPGPVLLQQQPPQQCRRVMGGWEAFFIALVLFIVSLCISHVAPAILVVCTSIWAAYDASKLEAKKYQYPAMMGAYGPIGTAFLCLFMWIVFFPLYLHHRSCIIAGVAKRVEEPPKVDPPATGPHKAEPLNDSVMDMASDSLDR